MLSIEILPASIGDAECLLELQKAAFIQQAEIYNDYTIPPLVESIDEFKTAFENHAIYKTVINSSIIGSVRVHVENSTCFISRLVVNPTQQNRGIGKALMAFVEKSYSSRVTRFELFTGHKSENNISLYKRLGYTVFKTDTNYVVPVIYMEKLVN